MQALRYGLMSHCGESGMRIGTQSERMPSHSPITANRAPSPAASVSNPSFPFAE